MSPHKNTGGWAELLLEDRSEMLFLQMLGEDGKVTSGQHVQQNMLLVGLRNWPEI